MHAQSSQRVTTPLIFIFWPLVTVRALLELVGLCENATEAEISSTLIASAVEAMVLNLVDTINLLSFWM